MAKQATIVVIGTLRVNASYVKYYNYPEYFGGYAWVNNLEQGLNYLPLHQPEPVA